MCPPCNVQGLLHRTADWVPIAPEWAQVQTRTLPLACFALSRPHSFPLRILVRTCNKPAKQTAWWSGLRFTDRETGAREVMRLPRALQQTWRTRDRPENSSDSPSTTRAAFSSTALAQARSLSFSKVRDSVVPGQGWGTAWNQPRDDCWLLRAWWRPRLWQVKRNEGRRERRRCLPVRPRARHLTAPLTHSLVPITLQSRYSAHLAEEETVDLRTC